MALYRLIDMTSQLFVKFIAIVIVSPIFALPGAVLAILGGWLGNIYMKAQLPVKRESNNARAPALGHLGASIAGLGKVMTPNECHNIPQYSTPQFPSGRTMHRTSLGTSSPRALINLLGQM